MRILFQKIPFQDMFSDCQKRGLVGHSELKKFKDHPELLPHPISKAARAIAKELEMNPDAGIKTCLCLKFGGDCNSGNSSCRRARGA